MIHNRRADDSFQTTVLTELGNIKALCATNATKNEAIASRVISLEKTNIRQWWYHAAQTILLGAFGLAKKTGVL